MFEEYNNFKITPPYHDGRRLLSMLDIDKQKPGFFIDTSNRSAGKTTFYNGYLVNNFLKKGDLIIEKSGGTKTHSVGYVNIFEGEDDKYVCNNFILPLRPNTELVFPKYLFWQLHGMYEAGRFSDCYNKTTGIQNLQKKTYFSKDINLPSKEEQIKIAVHLDKIQSAIDNKKQQLSLLDEAVKSEFIVPENIL